MITRGKYEILIGDVRERLEDVPFESQHCCVTSPPYWNLRDYQVDGQIGSEPTPDDFLGVMVDVFRGVRRVLRQDGVLFLNLGDCYAQDKKWGGETSGKHVQYLHGTNNGIGRNRTKTGLPGGNLVLMPHRVAMALQQDGWVLRQTIIWSKPNPMPESVTGSRWVRCRVKVKAQQRGKQNGSAYQAHKRDMSNGCYLGSAEYDPCPGCAKCEANGGYILRRGSWRPTTSHEYIFMFTGPGKYFCDGDAVSEPVNGNAHSRGNGVGRKAGEVGESRHDTKQNAIMSAAINDLVERKNPRSVWSIGSEKFKGLHFATFPTELAKRCILAATSTAGCCGECGAAYAPVVHSERVPTRPGTDSKVGKRDAAIATGSNLGRPTHPNIVGNRDPERHVAMNVVLGHRPTCGCDVAAVPCRVIDPFCGSGTTLQVATWLGRDATGIELNSEYVSMAHKRIATEPRCLMVKAVRRKRRLKDVPKQKELFDGELL